MLFATSLHVQTKEVDPFECNIPKEDITQEDISNFIFAEDDDVVYVEA